MMNDENFPNYYTAGDKASLTAQNFYTNYIKWSLISMLVAAAIAIYSFHELEVKRIAYIISGLLLLVSTILSLVIKNKKYESTWYRGRALAESAKTLTWRFMTKSEYFENTINDEEAKKRFIGRMNEIKNEFKDLNSSLQAKHLSLPIITNKMIAIRQLNLQDRMAFYLKNRIENQISWYSNKADTNKNKYEIWFWAVIVMQILAIVSVGYLIFNPESKIKLVGLFTTLSASCLGWLQLKKYQENKEAYTTAVSELNQIKQESELINSEEKFQIFVLDSENAMSREHTLCLAQKRI